MRNLSKATKKAKWKQAMEQSILKCVTSLNLSLKMMRIFRCDNTNLNLGMIISSPINRINTVRMKIRPRELAYFNINRCNSNNIKLKISHMLYSYTRSQTNKSITFRKKKNRSPSINRSS